MSDTLPLWLFYVACSVVICVPIVKALINGTEE